MIYLYICLFISLIQVLIPKLKETGTNPNVTINIMAAIGELAQVAGMGLRPWVTDLCPIIMEMLQDASSLPKREVIYILSVGVYYFNMSFISRLLCGLLVSLWKILGEYEVTVCQYTISKLPYLAISTLIKLLIPYSGYYWRRI